MTLRSSPFRSIGSILLCAVLPTLAHAQEVRVRVADPTGYATIGAMVSLLGPDSTVSARGIVGALGRVRLVAEPGPYRLLVERPGFVDTIPARLTIGPDGTDSLLVQVGVTRPTLPGRLSRLPDRCTTPGLPAELRSMWREIRKTFRVVLTTEDDHLADLGVAAFTRQLSSGLKIDDEHVTTLLEATNRPANALAPADLVRQGYFVRTADSARWAAPDIRLFLDPDFTATHCFGLVNGTDKRVGHLGLAFAPVASGRVDLAGTFWVETTRRELRATDYHFTNLPKDWHPDRVGGSIETHTMPPGFWVTRFWYQRTPELRLGEEPRKDRLTGYAEAGGEVTSVTPAIDTTDRMAAAMLLAQRERERRAVVARVEGLVTDTLGFPVPNAEVSILGTDYHTQADSSGHFVLDGLPPGPQIARARKIGYRVQYFVLRLQAGQVWDGKVAIARQPPHLGDIVVTGRWGKPARYANTTKYDDFYRRRASKAGYFITRPQIDSLAAGHISELLHNIPGVRVSYGTPGVNEEVSFLTCQPDNIAVWIDGQRMSGNVGDVLPLIAATDVEAMEVYQRQSSVPAEFRDDACAAIVLWTR